MLPRRKERVDRVERLKRLLQLLEMLRPLDARDKVLAQGCSSFAFAFPLGCARCDLAGRCGLALGRDGTSLGDRIRIIDGVGHDA